jgi:hypothetical protein
LANRIATGNTGCGCFRAFYIVFLAIIVNG